MKKKKIYTAKDFERYYAGTMPANEMHTLEQAALEDPFLADALEGYTNATSFEDDITELKERLNEKRKKKKSLFISVFTQNGWWRIAALVVIIAGAGYFFYKMNYNNKENSLAQSAIKSEDLKKDSTVFHNDSATKNDVAFENPNTLKTGQNKKNSLSPSSSGVKENILNPDSNRLTARNDYAYDEEKEIPKKQYDKIPTEEYLLKGKVTDEKGKALAFATIKDQGRDKATMTDTTGYFLISAKDSNVTATISALGYSTKKVTLQKDKQPVIAMNRSSASLVEVTATTSAKYKRLKDTASVSKELGSKVSGIEMKKTATPPLANNNEKFDQYLEENTKPIYNETNEQLTGEVFLSFIANNKGRPRKIKVIKSTCAGCEKEAIDLLKNGPDWIVEKQKTKTVLIKF